MLGLDKLLLRMKMPVIQIRIRFFNILDKYAISYTQRTVESCIIKTRGKMKLEFDKHAILTIVAHNFWGLLNLQKVHFNVLILLKDYFSVEYL